MAMLKNHSNFSQKLAHSTDDEFQRLKEKVKDFQKTVNEQAQMISDQHAYITELSNEKERADNLALQLTEANYTINDKDLQIKNFEQEINNLKEKLAQSTTGKDLTQTIKNLQTQLDEKNAQILNWQKAFQEIQEKNAQFASVIDSLYAKQSESVEEAKSKETYLKKKIEELHNESMKKFEELDDLKESLAEDFRTRIESIQERFSQQRSHAIDNITKELQKKVEIIDDLEKKLADLKLKIKLQEEALRQLKKFHTENYDLKVFFDKVTPLMNEEPLLQVILMLRDVKKMKLSDIQYASGRPRPIIERIIRQLENLKLVMCNNETTEVSWIPPT